MCRSACSVPVNRNSRIRPTNTVSSIASSKRWRSIVIWSANGAYDMGQLNRLSATAAARKLATREISAQALLADCVERIGERDAAVHAWTFVDSESAMRRARVLDSLPASGLLHGIPIGV